MDEGKFSSILNGKANTACYVKTRIAPRASVELNFNYKKELRSIERI